MEGDGKVYFFNLRDQAIRASSNCLIASIKNRNFVLYYGTPDQDNDHFFLSTGGISDVPPLPGPRLT